MLQRVAKKTIKRITVKPRSILLRREVVYNFSIKVLNSRAVKIHYCIT